jgi:hypothetical protein
LIFNNTFKLANGNDLSRDEDDFTIIKIRIYLT